MTDAKKTKKDVVESLAKPERKVPQPDHPPFAEMIARAVKDCRVRKGVTRQGITKYIFKKFHLEPSNSTTKHINVALKKNLDLKTINLLSGSGASGRYRFNDESKKAKTMAAHATAKKSASKKKSTASKSGAKKRPANSNKKAGPSEKVDDDLSSVSSVSSDSEPESDKEEESAEKKEDETKEEEKGTKGSPDRSPPPAKKVKKSPSKK